MNAVLIVEFIILGVVVFQLLFIANLVKKFLNDLPDAIHDYAINEIQRILNDKSLFDQLKNYGQSLTQGVLQGVQKKTGKNDFLGEMLGTLLNRFLPFNLTGGNQGEQGETQTERVIQENRPKPPRNPFA